ncbi:hypothetical protein LCGC14_0944700 [marine sediment metagenome]|uniref:Uncharacterized protein n=1 Tax=marine sediment metagenome TaxID=412755 RepID=A0A0F9NJ18_9ZZZZ
MPTLKGQKPKPQVIQIRMGDVPFEVCAACKGEVFIQGVKWKKVSAIQSLIGKEEVATWPALICANANCQTVVGETPKAGSA